MAELEKVIKGINCHIKKDCRENACPYACVYACESVLLNDALELLKEQQKTGKWERHYLRPGVYADLFWWCSCCGEPTRYNDAGIFYQHCPHCGAKLEPCKED